MPIAVLGLFQGASLTRYVRSAVLDVIRLDYVTTARAKGLGERVVIIKHVVRNALIPVVTLVALQMPAIFGGAIVTEQIFRVPGIGSLLISSILANDTPVDHGGDLRLRLPRRPLQPDRRHPLWLARPPHHLPLSCRAAARRQARQFSPWLRGMAALPPPPAGGGRALSILLRDRARRRCSGRSLWTVPINEIDFTRPAEGARRGRIRSAPTTSARTCSRACSTAAASRWPSASPRWSIAIVVGTIVGAIAGMSRGCGRRRR